MFLEGMTKEDIQKKNFIEKSVSVRAKRDKLMKEIVDSYNAVRWETISEEEKMIIKIYRQSLLDIPQQSGFPFSVVWPEKP